MKKQFSRFLITAYCHLFCSLIIHVCGFSNDLPNQASMGESVSKDLEYLKSILRGGTERKANNALPQRNVFEIEESLDSIIADLKAIACVPEVDFMNFTQFSTATTNKLSDVGLFMQGRELSEDLSEKFIFARDMFQAMEDTVRCTDVFSSSKIEDVLLWKLTDMKLGSFCLRKSDGTPDVTKPGFKETVDLLAQQLNLCYKLFQKLNMVSYRETTIIVHLFAHMKGLLTVLAKKSKDVLHMV